MQVVFLHKSIVVQKEKDFSLGFLYAPVAGKRKTLLSFREIMKI